MSQPQSQPPQSQQSQKSTNHSAKFQFHSASSSSLDDLPSPLDSNNNSNQQQSRNEKYHKSIKKSLNKMSFTTPNYSDSDIFERTCQSHGILNSKKTPSHYNLENYTSPILDTITNNPLNAVTLNCFCENDDNDNDENTFNDYQDNKQQDDNDNDHDHDHDQEYSSEDNDDNDDNDENKHQQYTGPQQLENSNEESFTSPFIRPRARSIISQSLISTLNHKNNSSCTTPHHHHHSSHHSSHHQSVSGPSSTTGAGGAGGVIHSSASSTGFPSLPFHPLTKRSKSYAGQTHNSKDDSNAIDFYSFADMNQKENDHEPYATTTISAKDYIGRF